MAPPVRGIIDSITDDFEMICHYANAIYFRCLYKAPTDVLFSSSFICLSHNYHILEYFSENYEPSEY